MEQVKYYAELGVEDDGQTWGSCIHYNLDLMEQSIDYLDAFIWILLISAFIVDILCYKYRHLARYYMFYQMAHLTVTRMIPNPGNDINWKFKTQLVYAYGAINLSFYCD